MSIEPTIEQKNREIAIFMDLVPVPCGTKCLGDIKHPEISEAFLKYHSSWDQLMPVYHQIREKAFLLRNCDKGHVLFSKLNSQLLYGTIADVHLKAYDFIQWLNQSTTTNDTTKGND